MKIHVHPKSVIPWIKNHRKLSLWIASGALVLIVILGFVVPKPIRIATVEVQKGEFIIDLTTTGEIDALNSTTVSVPRMRRRFNVQITDIVEEGTIVKKGDFLLQLDASEAQQRVDQTKDNLANAKAQLESEKATISSNMAQLQSSLESEMYNMEQAKLSLKMMQFEAEAKKQEAELSLKKAEVNYAQAEEKIHSQNIIDKATLMKAQLTVRQQEAELAEAEKSLADLTLTAPIDGLVVYKEIFSGTGMKKVQIGDSPWMGMPVIAIPDLSIIQSKTVVNEADINKLEKGQNVVITVDALEGKSYYGKISRVASLARREESTNTKVFDIEVTLDSTDGMLRPGMTCTCQLIVGRIQDAVYIPLQAVFQKEDTTVVYVMGSGGPRMREVKVGIKSSDRIVIESGLKEGEKVCMRDPTVPLEEVGGQTETATPSNKPKARRSQPNRGMQIRIG